MKIRKHSESHLEELDDGSQWQVLPGDLDVTLHWRPESDLTLVHIDDGVCSHALVSVDENHTVRVLPAGEKWSLPEVKAKLKEGRNLLSLPGSHAEYFGFHSFVQRTGPAQSLLCAYWRMLTTARS